VKLEAGEIRQAPGAVPGGYEDNFADDYVARNDGEPEREAPVSHLSSTPDQRHRGDRSASAPLDTSRPCASRHDRGDQEEQAGAEHQAVVSLISIRTTQRTAYRAAREPALPQAHRRARARVVPMS